MLSPTPDVIEMRRRRFQATDLGVINVDRQSNVSDVVAKNALMLFWRRPSRSPSRIRSIPGCARSVCLLPSPIPPCSRRDILASMADHVASLPAIGGPNAANSGRSQIDRTIKGFEGKNDGLMTNIRDIPAILNPMMFLNNKKNGLIAIFPLFMRRVSLFSQASRVLAKGSSLRENPCPYGSGRDLRVRRVRAMMDSSSGSISLSCCERNVT